MLTVNELFSGIGSQSAALERLGIDFKIVGIAEIDKYAIKSYEAIHGSVKNYGDISKIEKLDYADFWTYSFPCQDISVAGKQRGINENTRSGLLYEVERLLYKSIMYGEQPKYLMLENVKNLVGKQFKPQFDEWLKRLDELGYNTYWKVLNAKNYGIPQNRERVFAISIRKDIDTGYEFPVGFDNGKRLKDILESEVDEKYYINLEKANKLIEQLIDNGDMVLEAQVLTPRRTEYGKSIRKSYESGAVKESRHNMTQLEPRIDGICNTLTTVLKDNYVVEPNTIIDDTQGFDGTRYYSENSPTLRSQRSGLKTIDAQFRIRKLTPLEYWRLMGFTDEQFHKAEQVNSNSQLYKQAGNSIVVDVLYYLFKNLFDKN